MPDWLVEDPTMVYLVFATLGLVLIASWWRKRSKGYLLGVAGVVVLLGAVAFLDWFVVTEREKLVTTIKAMGGRIRALDLDGTFSFVSDEFVHGGMRKNAFQQYTREGVSRFRVDEMQIWDVTVGDVDSERRTARVEFNAKVKGNWSAGAEFFRVESDWNLERDGQWRMRGFELFQPFANSRDAVHLPGVGR